MRNEVNDSTEPENRQNPEFRKRSKEKGRIFLEKEEIVWNQHKVSALLTREVKRWQNALRGKARLKQSGPKEASIVKLWTTMEDQYGNAAASRLSPF